MTPLLDFTLVAGLATTVADALEAEATRRSGSGQSALGDAGREALATKVVSEALEALDTDRLARGVTRLSPAQEQALTDRVLAQVLGLGPVELLLADPTIEEITASRWDRVFVYRSSGAVELLDDRLWSSEAELTAWLAQLARTKGRTERQFNAQSPLLVMRLGEGLRLAAHRDVAQHVGFALRRNTLGRVSLDQLGRRGMLPPALIELLRAVVRSKEIRIVFAGATSSGKSTTARACLAELDRLAHVIVIEDTAELDLFDEVDHPNIESWEQREPNAEGEGGVTQGRLVTHALRARPDWLVCGEVRDADAAVPMIKAMTQGQASLTTVHAGSAVAALDKLALYLGTGEDRLPIDVAHHQLSLAVDFVLHLAHLPDGRRVATELVQVSGFDGQRCTTNRLYRLDPDRGPVGFARLTDAMTSTLAEAGFDTSLLASIGAWS
ncbi:MAG: CpaF family protein [Acidimicrobiales bacterium]